MATATSTIEFTGRVSGIGDRLVIRFPADASAALPSRGQVAAAVTVNDATRETVVEPDGRRGHWLPADDLGLAAGDAAAVRIAPTRDWPEPAKPDDFASALAAAPDTADLWDEITPMARWEWVRWIGATKNPQTRERRIEVAIDKLRKGKRRPCCFDLSSCTDPEVAKSGKLIED
ncbi:MAG: YdeI/OmpD-associated family protein [Gordonia sp. (in: high G+C Gram-positive bacteria)]|uniref:YdeI/OmpD-associated family protein n=1 Tax=Gordonia sp. (in: high G+C Gram-positive bacteria) TaxID=84139 RepID=UPI0039E56E86